MILYGDTSALVKLVLAEAGTAEMRGLVAAAERTISATIAYAELRAATAAALRDNRIPPARRDAVMALVAAVWGNINPVTVDWPLVHQAGELAERHHLRGYDAVHLAALMRAGAPGMITLACWDTDLRRAASGLGYAVFPS